MLVGSSAEQRICKKGHREQGNAAMKGKKSQEQLQYFHVLLLLREVCFK